MCFGILLGIADELDLPDCDLTKKIYTQATFEGKPISISETSCQAAVTAVNVQH